MPDSTGFCGITSTAMVRVLSEPVRFCHGGFSYRVTKPDGSFEDEVKEAPPAAPDLLYCTTVLG